MRKSPKNGNKKVSTYRTLLELVGGEEVETELFIEATVVPGTPGRFCGPPELCFPSEGPEVEDLVVWEVLNIPGQHEILWRERTDVEDNDVFCERISCWLLDAAEDDERDMDDQEYWDAKDESLYEERLGSWSDPD